VDNSSGDKVDWTAEAKWGTAQDLPRGRVELEGLRGLLDDAEADTKLWLQIGPSAEERVFIYGMQTQMSELYGIVTRRLENRPADSDDLNWIQGKKELLSLLKKVREVRGCIVGASLGRLEERLGPSAAGKRRASSEPNDPRKNNPAKGKLPDRRARVNGYIEEVLRKTGRRITRKDIWSKAGYKSRTEFERWERHDEKHPNKAADRIFSQILREKPHLK
jgi:hypothetical protein